MGYRNSYRPTPHARGGNARHGMSYPNLAANAKHTRRDPPSWPTMSKTPLPPPKRDAQVSTGNWFTNGGWYPLVTLPTFGFASWIPFTHAAHRLDNDRLVKFGAAYSFMPLVSFILLGVTPTDVDGNPTSVALPLIAFLLTFAGMAAGTTQLLLLSRRVTAQRKGIAPKQPARRAPKYITPPRSAPWSAPSVDPALARALEAREKRAVARELARTDPMLAEDLHVGRPDLGHDFDDGGLIDINSAPADLMVAEFHLKPSDGESIVEVRERRGGFASVEEMLVMVELPVSAWNRIKDRGVTLSA